MPSTTVTTDDRGATLHRIATGHQIRIESACPDPVPNNVFETMVGAAIGAVSDAADRFVAVDRDADLSVAGKERRFADLRAKAIAGLANVAASIGNLETGLAKREAALLAVPTIDPSNFVAAAEAREVRAWWKDLPLKDRAKMLEQIDREPPTPELQVIMLALLRSPVRQLDYEVAAVRAVWERTKRLGDPATAIAVETDKASIEWARRGLAHAIGNSALALKLDPQATLRQIAADHPTVGRSFGFDDGQIAGMQRQLEAEKTAVVVRAAA